MVRRRDIAENAVTTIDDVHNVVVRIPHVPSHRWMELRCAIRSARREGYAFFDIDRFIGYAVIYNQNGVSENDIRRPRMLDDVQNRLVGNKVNARNGLVVQQIPMRERDAEAEPIIRFFSYEVPMIAISDFIHNRLSIAAVVSTGRLDEALLNLGFNIASTDGHPFDLDYTYSLEVSWPSGEPVAISIPSATVTRHITRAVQEFTGLDDVVSHLAAIKQLPEIISYDEWLATIVNPLSDR